jgi:hypothetical protein
MPSRAECQGVSIARGATTMLTGLAHEFISSRINTY